MPCSGILGIAFLSSLAMKALKKIHGKNFMFEDISSCRTDGRAKQIAVCNLYGALLRSSDPFPFFMLLAFETGFLVRALILLTSFPVSILIRVLISEEAALQMLVFITFVGLKASTVELLSKTVLAKAYLQDVNWHTLAAFGSFGKKYVVTGVPSIMVEPFLREYLGIEAVTGSKMQITSGHCTGLMVDCISGGRKLGALKEFFGRINVSCPDVGFGSDTETSDHSFLSWCKEAYTVTGTIGAANPPEQQQLVKPLIFHDGRLAVLPTPPMALAIFLWTPLAIALAVLRITAAHLPYHLMYPISALLGMKVRVKGIFPPQPSGTHNNRGTLFVCSHKTLLDPVVVSSLLKHKLTAVTYSISRLSELLSSIKTVRLSRDREKDSLMMRRLLQTENVIVCPEGTTCREAFLLRFSPLFAEVSEAIVPVMIYVETPFFYGTTATGWKWLDPFFVLMNPKPVYVVEFLEQLPADKTCGRGGNSSVQVANYVQQELAKASGFQCTSLTRKDKYGFLAGKDEK